MPDFDMEFYYYLNYIIFDFYKKRNDSAPLSASFFLPLLFISFNAMSILFWSSVLFDFKITITKKTSILLCVVIAIINYFLLYHKRRYKNIFENIEKEKRLYKEKYGVSAKIYIAFTILIFLSALFAVDLKSDGKL